MGTSIKALTFDETPELVNYVGDFNVLVAPMGCKRYDDVLKELTKPLRRKRKGGRITDEEMADFMKEAGARALLVGWENLEDDDGEEIPYSPAKALEMFQENYQFYKRIIEIATGIAEERQTAETNDEGNSEKPSSGS